MSTPRRRSWPVQAAWLAAATIGARLLGFVGSFTVAGVLGPAPMGVWSTLRAAASCSGLAHLGAIEAYRREYPRLVNEGRTAEAERVEHAAHRVAWCGAAIAAAIVVTLVEAFAAAWPETWLAAHRLAILALGASIVPVVLATFWNERLGLQGRFAALSRLRLWRGATYAVTLPLGALAGGVDGTAAALLVAEFVLLLLTRRTALLERPLVRAPIAVPDLRLVVRLGLPITLTWWIVAVQDGIDRLAAVSVLEAEAAGCYALAAMFASMVFLLPEAISKVLSPRLCAVRAGAAGRREVEDRVDRVVATLSLALPLLTGIGATFLPVFLHTFLPRFAGADAPGMMLLLGAPLAALIPCGIDLLVATDRSHRLLLVGPTAVLARLSLCAVGGRITGDATGVAIGSVAANLLFLALLAGAAGRSRTTRRFLQMTAPSVLLAAAFLLGGDLLGDAPATLAAASTHTTLFVLLALPLLVLFGRRQRAWCELWQRLRPRTVAAGRRSPGDEPLL